MFLILQSKVIAITLFVCLSVFCVSAMLLNTIHGTVHGTLAFNAVHVFSFGGSGEAGVC